MKKRWIAWTLLFAMAVMLLPGGASAAAPTEGDCGSFEHREDVQWHYADGVLTFTGHGPIADFDNLYDEHNPWEAWLPGITRIVVGEGITSVGYRTFADCTSLKTLELPASLLELSPELTWLNGCAALEEITVPAGGDFCAVNHVLYSGDRKCLVCYPGGKQDKAFTVPPETEEIGRYAFCENSFLETVVLPDGLKRIEEGAFCECSALLSISAPDSLEYIGEFVFDGTAYDSDPANMDHHGLYLGNWLLSTDYTGRMDSFEIRSGTVGLAGRCLSYYKLHSLNIPDSVKYICDYALAWTELEEIVLPDRVEFLGYDALRDNEKLKKAVLPAYLRKLPACVFYGCTSLTDIVLPPELTEIEGWAFRDCGSLEKIVIPEKVTEIGDSAFAHCSSLKEAHIPAGVTEIGQNAFSGCSVLRDIYFGGSRNQWDQFSRSFSFYDVEFTRVHFDRDSGLTGTCGENLTWTLENGILTISGQGKMTDYDLRRFSRREWSPHEEEIETVVISEGVTYVSQYAFDGCTALREVRLADSVTSVGGGAFCNCKALETLRLSAGVSEFDGSAVRSCRSLSSVTVDPGNPNFTSADGLLWSKDRRALCCYPPARKDKEFTLPPGTKEIRSDAFQSNLNLQCLGLPRGIRYIDACAFFECCSLTDLYYAGSAEAWKNVKAYIRGMTVHFCWEPGTKMPATLRALETSNQNFNDCHSVSSPVSSYLSVQPDGSLLRVESCYGAVLAETYDAEKKLVDRRIVTENELPRFGGFYEGTQYYFLVFAQSNPDESDTREVFRTVRYTKDWKRVDSVGIYGADTSVPLIYGSLRMAQCGDYLYVHTCHEMYTSSDGLRHQSNFLFRVHIPTMKASFDFAWFGYISHCFNQFIDFDGNHMILVGHGDGGPRAVCLLQFSEDAAQGGEFGQCNEAYMLKIAGAVGDNFTGATVGGFEITEDSYLVAGTSADQEGTEPAGCQNLFLSISPKDSLKERPEENPVELRWLTDFSLENPMVVSTPQLVKITEDRLLILWTEQRTEADPLDRTLCYRFVDGSGRDLSETCRSENAWLSDCKPVANGNEVTWYVTGTEESGSESAPTFFTISLDHPETVKAVKIVSPDCAGDSDLRCDGGESCPSRRFTDVPGPDNWAHAGIDYAVSRGLFGGTGEHTFEPDSPMTRAMLVTVLWRYEGKPEEGRNIFTDVPENEWYTEPVAWAAENQVVGGVGGGLFDPDSNVTREQMATILCRYAEKKGIDTSYRADLNFPDSFLTDDYAVEPLRWAVGEGLINGSDGRLLPRGSATRAQVAAILMRFIENVAE